MKMERTKTDTLGVHHCTMVLPVFVLYMAFLQQSRKTGHSQQGLTDFPTYNSIWLDLLVFRYNRICPACCVSAGNVSKHSVCIIDMQMCCVDSLVWCQTFRMAQLQYAPQLCFVFYFNPHFDSLKSLFLLITPYTACVYREKVLQHITYVWTDFAHPGSSASPLYLCLYVPICTWASGSRHLVEHGRPSHLTLVT